MNFCAKFLRIKVIFFILSLGLSFNIFANSSMNNESLNKERGKDIKNYNTNSTNGSETSKSGISKNETSKDNANKGEINKDNAKHDRYLFVQSAHHATLEKHPNEKGAYLITLHNISPYVTYFTERPTRKAGLVHISKLLNLWERKEEDAFKVNPPNADVNAFVVEDNNGGQLLNFIVVLTEPVYNQEKKTLTYKIQTISGSPTSIPDSKQLNHVTLFIDDVCLDCWYP